MVTLEHKLYLNTIHEELVHFHIRIGLQMLNQNTCQMIHAANINENIYG